MASSAFNEFRYNVLDAKRLHKAHKTLSNGAPGKKGLGHITRSGVVMLCAAWERYHEAVLVEAVAYLASKVSDPNTLPLDVRKHLSLAAKNSRHELSAVELAGNGWRSVYVALANDEASSLNTPKSEKLKSLYVKLTGVSNVADFWTIGVDPIDSFVSVRGEIAHNGRKAPYIAAGELQSYIDMIEGAASEHDNKFCDYLKGASKSTCQPWRRTA